MNTLTSPAHTGRDETVDELIARVLCQAHRAMCDRETPKEARIVLNVAHSFADELTTLYPGFDRVQFVRDVTEERQEG